MDVTLRNELTRPYKIPRKRTSDEKNDETDSGKPMKKNGTQTKTAHEIYRSPVLTFSQRAQPQPSTSNALKANFSKTSNANMTTSNNARNILKRNHTTSSPTVEPKTKSGVAQAKVGVNSKMPEKRKTTGNTK